MFRVRAILIVAVLAVACLPSTAGANPPGVTLTLSGPAEYEVGVPVVFSGALLVLDTAGLPLQDVALLIDGDSVAVTQTDLNGGWSVTYTFDANPPSTHSVRAVAFGGLPLLETQSPTLTITRKVVAAGLVINEVDYDQPGTDTAEFIEIFNATATPVDLSGLAVVLVNGANSTEYARANLSGVLGAGAYAVVTAGTVPVPGGTLTFTLPPGTVQNGSPDGIALFHTSTLTLIDALSYEGSINAAIITGAPGTYDLVEGDAATAVDSTLVAGSLSRLPNGTDTNNADGDWTFIETPTPGSANP